MSAYQEWEESGHPECPRCGGGHPESDHDVTPEEAGIPHTDFGTLYHGTPNELEGDSIDPTPGRMPGVRGLNRSFATTSFGTAKSYAENGMYGTGYVHEVVPHPEDHSGPFDYEMDPNSGTMGWQDAPTIYDAQELASYGDEGGAGISLMFRGRMLSKRQFDLSKGEQPD